MVTGGATGRMVDGGLMAPFRSSSWPGLSRPSTFFSRAQARGCPGQARAWRGL